jgi:hypothetical protein
MAMAWPLMLFLACAVALPASVHGLECYCETCDDNKCVTDGVCQVSIRRNSFERHPLRLYQCIDRAKLLPPEHPIMCYAPEKFNHTVKVGIFSKTSSFSFCETVYNH